ncbi:hypothetical protein [Rhodococcus sp. 05-2254-6]|uniref:hypothetical protein n=1 Tax=Rhodococcus sp. 05-2254-6 TaxID=2022489 RepID=UPI00117B12AC|nr:hypothetical protein [Rhodococcus sp. 05-2254-6]
MFLDERLTDVNEPPGVREAVTQDLANQVETVKQRTRQQVRQLRSASSQRIPDAYLHDEEQAEEALQQAAAGIRSARASQGFVSSDARRFEAAFALPLASTARWAVLQESSRVPRPATRHHLLAPTLTPIPWHDNEHEWPPTAAINLEGERSFTGSDALPVRVDEKPYKDWVQLGMFERQGTMASKYPTRTARQLIISTGLELVESPASAREMPLGTAPPNAWLTRYDRLAPGLDPTSAAELLEDLQGPLTAMVTYEGQRGAPNRDRGVGLHPFCLAPRIELVALLDLSPEAPAVRHCLVDSKGPALVGRIWHGFLVHDGNYEPLSPAINGTDLIIRPDLYARLERAIPAGRAQWGVTVWHHERANSEELDD